MRKRITIFAAIMAVVLLTAATPWTNRQSKAHQIAQIAREIGEDENSPIIQEAKFLWWCDTEDARIVAKTIMGEALNCTDRHQQLVAMTVFNRVNDMRGHFPNTVRGVIEQQGQYSPEYARNLPDYYSADENTRRCFRNAYAAFMGETECPPNVIYASEFHPSVLGTGLYEESVTYINGIKFSTTYFSFG